MNAADSTPCIAVVGGGVAGLAAAAALAAAGRTVCLYEARRQLGGRAASFYDEAGGHWIDYCQHVSLGCCTELDALFRRTGVSDCFRTYRRLHFFTPDGTRCDLEPLCWLPAPLHLLPALLSWKALSFRERLALANCLWRLVHCPRKQEPESFESWLVRQHQPAAVIERFWQPVLVSALGEELNRVGFSQARKVLADAFLGSRTGLRLAVPLLPLRNILDIKLAAWLESRGVSVHRGATVEHIHCREQGGVLRAARICVDGRERAVDSVVLAVSWRRAAHLFERDLAERMGLIAATQLETSPITGVHLWIDRAITELHHAVLLGRLSQWLFRPAFSSPNDAAGLDAQNTRTTPRPTFYHQVVISASRSLAARPKEEVLSAVWQDLCAVFPAARDARVLHYRVVTDPHAVFSPTPRNELLRPASHTVVENLALAGDWVQTGWPATMESAARSGAQAARIVLAKSAA